MSDVREEAGRAARHRDGSSIYAFEDEALLVCPTCAHLARSRLLDPPAYEPRRLTCDHCGSIQSWTGWAGESSPPLRRRAPVLDIFFGLPLWLQTPCCGEQLWAYNTGHLAFLEAFVGARLRERARPTKYGWSNKALASRLPSWLKSHKNRAEVLACLDRMRRTLA